MPQVFSVCFGAFNASDISANPETMGHLTSIQGRKQLCAWDYVTAQGSCKDSCSAIPACNSPEEFHILGETWEK